MLPSCLKKVCHAGLKSGSAAACGAGFVAAAKELNVSLWQEVFADRRYTPEGYLVPRSQANAMIEDEGEAVAQALRMANEGEVIASDGSLVKVQADTLCIHGDGPSALEFVKKIRSLL